MKAVFEMAENGWPMCDLSWLNEIQREILIFS
jgi:hypothetical protein